MYRYLRQLRDVVFTNPNDGDCLVYDATARKWNNVPSFSGAFIAKTTDTNLTAGAPGQLVMDEVLYDVGGYFDSDNGQFTIPAGKAGLYVATAIAVVDETGVDGSTVAISIKFARAAGDIGVVDQQISTEDLGYSQLFVSTAPVPLEEGDHVLYYGILSVDGKIYGNGPSDGGVWDSNYLAIQRVGNLPS